MIKDWYGVQDPAKDFRPVREIYSELRFLGASVDEARSVTAEVAGLRGGVSRSSILQARFKDLLAVHLQEVSALTKEGPKGSPNAYRAKGWVKSPAVAISRAAKATDPLLWAYGWRGGGPTPEVLIPEVLYDSMVDTYREVFHG